jgi:hypothetical protein
MLRLNTMDCDKCKLLASMIHDYKDMLNHVKQQNNALIGILDSRSHQLSKTIDNDNKLSMTLDDVLKMNNDTMTDEFILQQFEGIFPAYNRMAQLLIRYTHSDAIVYNKRNNSFRFLDRHEIVTESYVLFFTRVVDFFRARVKKLIIDANEKLTNNIDVQNRDVVDTEYTKDSNRINNLSLLSDSDQSYTEKIYAKYKMVFV